MQSTGGGKSLVYQLPAFLSTQLTLVVSPLLALMADQLRTSCGSRHEIAPGASSNGFAPARLGQLGQLVG